MRLLFILCLLALSSCFKTGHERAVPRISGSFFAPVDVSSQDLVEVMIGHQTLLMELDLGFSGDLVLAPDVLEQISSKTFLDTRPMYGMKGAEYRSPFYQIPKIRIGAMVFTNSILQEEGKDFAKDATLSNYDPFSKNPGRLGWQLFYNVNLLLDFKHHQIAFCDSLETLKSQGYSTENFIAVPLLLERGLVEFKAISCERSLRCVLDTGATHNIFNTALKDGKSIEEMFWDPEYFLKSPSFKIGLREFGPITFRRIPIKIPIHIEAILGMEFIREHLIFIDFEGRSIYFQATVEP